MFKFMKTLIWMRKISKIYEIATKLTDTMDVNGGIEKEVGISSMRRAKYVCVLNIVDFETSPNEVHLSNYTLSITHNNYLQSS